MSNLIKDVVLDSSRPKVLLREKHLEYVLQYGSNNDEYDYCMTEYIRMSGMYWVLTTLALMKRMDCVDKNEFREMVLQCVDNETGGVAGWVGHDPHLLYTLSAVQIACILDFVDDLPVDKIVKFVSSLQKSDGSFCGDKWGEVDTRFSFCAVACLSLLGHLDSINVEKAVEHVLKCQNFDGGFGSVPDSESHAGLIYCAVAFLSITQRLDSVDRDLLGWWLAERQLPSGGLNGRPEKLPDVCYSWWVLASLTILGRQDWIKKESLVDYILASQDTESGGFADRPGDIPDPFHTIFGIAGLSLLGDNSLEEVNPTYCMPQTVISRLNLKPQRFSST